MNHDCQAVLPADSTRGRSVRGGPAVALSALLLWVPPLQTPPQKQGIEIRGTVVSALEGKSVEGATVTLMKRVPTGQGMVEQTVTDERGTFTLRAPSAGEYSLSASRFPLAFGEYGRNPFTASPQRWFRVTGPTSGIVVELWALPIITGAVRDENDQPVARASIRIMQWSVLGGREVLRQRTRTPTDARGVYSLQQVPPGTYVLAAVPPAMVAGPAQPIQYYLNATTPTAATPVELGASRVTRGIDFVIRRERGFTISGAVEIPPGLPGPYILELYETPADGLLSNLEAARAVSKDGRFTFPPVAPGSYEIRFVRYAERLPNSVPDGAVRTTGDRRGPERLASIPDGPTWWAAERADVVDKDIDVSIRLRQGVRLRGRVVFEGSGPPPEPPVLPTRGVYLRSLDHRFFGSVQLGSPREDGSFRTVAVPPGRYALGMLDAYDGFHLESITVGGRDVAGVGFDLDRDLDDAVLTFSSRATVVSGRVAGEPGERFVLMWPQDETLWSASGSGLGRLYRAVTVDGSYRLAVFPGTYRLIALPGLPPPEWESPAYLRSLSLSPFAQEVIVRAGQTVIHNPPLATRR